MNVIISLNEKYKKETPNKSNIENNKKYEHINIVREKNS